MLRAGYSVRAIALVIAFISSLMTGFAQTASLVATYNFQGNLQATQAGAPALTAVNPRNTNRFVSDTVLGQTRTVYAVESLHPTQNGGLSLPTEVLLNPNSYSIEMVFAFTERPNTWRRIYDTLGRTSDRGLYLNPSNQFEFTRLSRGSFQVATGSYVHMTMTVSSNRVRLYANGNLEVDLGTTSMNLTTPNRVVHFFLDNTLDSGTSDFASARVALLKAYTNELTAGEVRDLAANPFRTAPAGAPSFTPAAVRNGATFDAATPLAPGAFFTIFGSGLSDSTGDWSGRFDRSLAPTVLNGTRVLLNDRPAFVSYTSPGQVNAIAPDTIVPGTVSVVVERNGVRSAAVQVQARAVNPSFFTYDPRNRRYIAALTADNTAYIAPADLFGVATLNGLAVRPAKVGDYVVAYGMGMGQTTPNLPAGSIPPAREGGHPIAGTTLLRLGTQTVTPLYVGLSGFAGVYIVGFQIPDLPVGEHELQITVNGVSSPAGFVIPVSP